MVNLKFYYYKYQWIAVIIILGFFIASIFYYSQAKQLETKPILNYTITEQYCHSYQKQSSVQIDYKNKTYTISIKRKECKNYPIGSQIELVYNDIYDYFYIPDGLKAAKAKIKVQIALLIFTLLPLRYFEILKKKK